MRRYVDNGSQNRQERIDEKNKKLVFGPLYLRFRARHRVGSIRPGSGGSEARFAGGC